VRSGGHAVVTASGLAVANVPWAPAYAASKRAVAAYADSLRLEYGDRITVTVVNPGYVRTPIHEVPAASGASLEGLVPADPMRDVVAAYLTAVTEKPRAMATSWRTALTLRFAARWPALADAVVAGRVRRLDRPAPSFVLGEEELARRAARSKATAR
jgi:short-subunit dehydrogenase